MAASLRTFERLTPRLAWLFAGALLAGWAAFAYVVQTGRYPVPHGPTILKLLPAIACAAVVLRGRPAPAALRFAAFGMLAVSAAAIATGLSTDIRVALGILATVFAVPLCLRNPAVPVVGIILLSSFFGTIEAFTTITIGPLIDVLLGALWLALGARLLSRQGISRVRLPAGAMILLLYVAVSALQILDAQSTAVGLREVHSTAWYALLFAVIGLSGWSLRTHERIARGVVLAAIAVGGYATLRFIIGPAQVELDQAMRQDLNLINGGVGLFGSFADRHQLSAWCGIVVPFLAIFGLSQRGIWRAAALAALALCITALLCTVIRAGVIGAVIGLVALGFAPGSKPGGARAGRVVLGLGIVLAIGATAFTLIVKDPQAQGRYGAIFSPGKDAAYNARTETWNRVLTDVGHNPWGHGLGTAGGIQQKYGSTITLGSEPIDNSYLYIAYQQGIWVAVLFLAGVLSLLVALALRSAREEDPRRRALGAASTGALASMAFILFTGDYIEGYNAIVGWAIVGIGVAQFAARPAAAAEGLGPAQALRPASSIATGPLAALPARARR